MNSERLIFGALIALGTLVAAGFVWLQIGLLRLNQILSEVETGQFEPSSSLSVGPGPIRSFRRRFDEILARLAGQVRDSRLMTGFMAHELRRPLGSILDNLDEVHADTTDETIRGRILAIRNLIEDMGDNMNELLLLGGTGLAPRNPSSVSGAAAVAVSVMEPKAAVKGLYLKADIEDGVWTLADDRNLFSAMLNLIENGIKYTRAGGVSVSVKRIDADRFAFVCLDTGLGISSEDMKIITMPLYRGTSGEGIEGHGLGLTLVRRVTRFYDLSFNIRDRNGGTEARITGSLCTPPLHAPASILVAGEA